MLNAAWEVYLQKCGIQIITLKGCPPSSLNTLNFDGTEKSKSPIVMTWTDGGIRPPHPDIIPANSIGGQDSLNGVLMIGDKGIISTNINDSSPLMPKLYLYDGGD